MSDVGFLVMVMSAFCFVCVWFAAVTAREDVYKPPRWVLYFYGVLTVAAGLVAQYA